MDIIISTEGRCGTGKAAEAEASSFLDALVDGTVNNEVTRLATVNTRALGKLAIKTTHSSRST
jgi:hypothetical protein